MKVRKEEYYSRQQLLNEIGEEGQGKLSVSSVLVIGAGGLGCPVLLYLAAAGIGKIGVVDGDDVSVSNLHRQLLFTFNDVGKNKAKAAANRLSETNPFIQIVAHNEFLSIENALAIVKEYDIVVDCTDNYGSRFLINDVCVLLKLPLIYGAIYRFQGQVAVLNYKGGPTYRCLFRNFPSNESITNCAQAGVIGILPGLVGLHQATESIKLILGIGELLSGNILLIDVLRNENYKLALYADPEVDYSYLNQAGLMPNTDYNWNCTKIENEISHAEFLMLAEGEELILLDVRELDEQPRFTSECIVCIPSSEVISRRADLGINKKIVAFCKSGMRASAVRHLLKSEFGYTNVYSLKGEFSEELFEKWKKIKSKTVS